MSGIIILGFGVLLLVAFGWQLLTKRGREDFEPDRARVGVINGSILTVIGLFMVLSTGPSHGKAVLEVLNSIPDSDSSVHHYRTGFLAEGVAIVVNDSAGYWVKDDQVYAVNEAASVLSPGIILAPKNVTWLKVEKVTK